jgi:two-component system, OmpR family, phosphate regulon sensor histidine kinase PhoR
MQNPVQKNLMPLNSYFENYIHTYILEFYLKSIFKKNGVTIDFEYAIYNYQNDEMVYGNKELDTISSPSLTKLIINLSKLLSAVWFKVLSF